MLNFDNQRRMKVSEGHMFHVRVKHIKNKYNYLIILVQYWIVELQYVPIDK